MSNLEKASRLLQDFAFKNGIDVDMYHAAKDLLLANLLMPDVQIIRTVKDLEGLDPDAVTIDNEETIEHASVWLDDSVKPYLYDERFLPAAVIATGAQVRAAREALEEEHE